MALALARFNPSTVISTVVPRAMPTGLTAFSVGGVVRLPVGWSVLAADKVKAARAARRDFIVGLWECRQSGRLRRLFCLERTAVHKTRQALGLIVAPKERWHRLA